MGNDHLITSLIIIRSIKCHKFRQLTSSPVTAEPLLIFTSILDPSPCPLTGSRAVIIIPFQRNNSRHTHYKGGHLIKSELRSAVIVSQCARPGRRAKKELAEGWTTTITTD